MSLNSELIKYKDNYIQNIYLFLGNDYSMGDGNDEGDSRFSVPSPYSKLYGPNRVNVPISGMKKLQN